MAEVIPFNAARRSPSRQQRERPQMPYETYAVYQQAESAFRALYFGRPLHTETLANHPSTAIVQRHWPVVEQLAETLRREKSLSREQVLRLLLQASLDTAVGAETQFPTYDDSDGPA
jgi:hypothetical protein